MRTISRHKTVWDILHVISTVVIMYCITLTFPTLLNYMGAAVTNNYDITSPYRDTMLELPVIGILIPIPIALGIILYRRRLFFETAIPDRGISLAALAGIVILGAWWSLIAFGFISSFLLKNLGTW